MLKSCFCVHVYNIGTNYNKSISTVSAGKWQNRTESVSCHWLASICCTLVTFFGYEVIWKQQMCTIVHVKYM